MTIIMSFLIYGISIISFSEANRIYLKIHYFLNKYSIRINQKS